MFRLINRVVDALLVLALAVIASVLVAQVTLRYFWHRPLPWPEELSQFLLVAISFLGMYRAFVTEEHIALRWLPRGPKLFGWLRAIGLGCVIIFLGYIGWGGLMLAIKTWGQPTVALRIPMGLPYLVIPIACFLSLIAVALTLWRQLTGRTNPDAKGAPEL